MTCITDNKCMSFPPIPNTCKGKNVHPLKSLSVKDIQGEWWALRGYHPVYDCFPCQHLSFEPMHEYEHLELYHKVSSVPH